MIKLNKTIQVYDCFTKWKDFNQIYLYGDPHFSDLESYKLRFPKKFGLDKPDPFCLHMTRIDINPSYTQKLVSELDEMQIHNINKIVGKKDVLICLGDVGNIECIKKLKAGYKVLILGNHDRGASYYKRETILVPFDGNKSKNHTIDLKIPLGVPVQEYCESINKCFNCNLTLDYFLNTKNNFKEDKLFKIVDSHLFDEVYEGTLQINPKIMLSHEPVEYKYCLNIHGHNHFGPACNNKVNVSKEGHFNAIAEAIDYKPISLAALIQKGFASKIPDIHRETIDRANNKENR